MEAIMAQQPRREAVLVAMLTAENRQHVTEEARLFARDYCVAQTESFEDAEVAAFPYIVIAEVNDRFRATSEARPNPAFHRLLSSEAEALRHRFVAWSFIKHGTARTLFVSFLAAGKISCWVFRRRLVK